MHISVLEITFLIFKIAAGAFIAWLIVFAISLAAIAILELFQSIRG